MSTKGLKRIIPVQISIFFVISSLYTYLAVSQRNIAPANISPSREVLEKEKNILKMMKNPVLARRIYFFFWLSFGRDKIYPEKILNTTVRNTEKRIGPQKVA